MNYKLSLKFTKFARTQRILKSALSKDVSKYIESSSRFHLCVQHMLNQSNDSHSFDALTSYMLSRDCRVEYTKSLCK